MSDTRGLPQSGGDACRQGVARRSAAMVATLVTAWVVSVGLLAAPAMADSCPNATARAQNDSAGLPDCRAYELVTNPFKEGFAPFILPMYTDEGDALTYQATGQFAGNGTGGSSNQYVATRSATGWTTASPGPRPPLYASFGNGDAAAMSMDLRSSLWLMASAGESSEVSDFYRRTPDGVFTRLGPGPNPATLPPSSPGAKTGVFPQDVAASTDLSHVMFTLGGAQVYPGVVLGVGTDTVLYAYNGAGGDHPSLVGVDNAGQQISTCDTFAGSRTSAYRAMSLDGRVIFWSACGGDGGVWARINDTTTFEVSASLCNRPPSDPAGICDAPATAVFQGANADGTRAFFTTPQQLVDGDTDEANDLYACDIPRGTPAPVGLANPCSALHQVSGSATGADVEGIVRVSDDGSRVYFVAHGVLSNNLGAHGMAAMAGEDNLYVWHADVAHPGGQTAFVGKLDPNDAALWAPELAGGRMAQTTDDGRYLVLSTYSPLLDADTDGAQDVYRYDADTGAIVRLSTGPSGVGGNAGLDATLSLATYSAPRATARARTVMTADASIVVFRTSEALSANDTNGTVDAYAWHDGDVSLISSGRASLDDTLSPPTVAMISASGRDIYFSTTAPLTGGDGDTQLDLYDARVGGGFEAVPAVTCLGDSCQGLKGGTPGLGAPDSNAPTGITDVPRPVPAFSFKKVSAAALKRFASSGKLTLSVTASTPGTLAAKATATIARKSAGVASARRVLATSGTTSLVLTLSKKARAQLAARGKLSVKIVVSHSRVAFTRSTTLGLTHAKPQRKASRPKAKSSVGRTATSLKGGRS